MRPAEGRPPEAGVAVAAGDPGGLPLDKQNQIKEAIDRGVAYLRRTQRDNGSWWDGTPNQRNWAVGLAALPGLALLECGVPAKDPAVQKAARFVRHQVAPLIRTYDLSLAILFLDRLGQPEDHRLIQSLALRLVAGQNAGGGWGYNCPLLQPAQEQQLLHLLRQPIVRKPSKSVPAPRTLRALDEAGGNRMVDHSNTQFALLALWAARCSDLPLESALVRIEQRFRSSQQPAGWSYRCDPRIRPYGSMTCVGLLALAVGWGCEPASPGIGLGYPRTVDKGFTQGLQALAVYLNDPADSRWPQSIKGVVNLYFLWSVERVGVLCGLRTIGGRDWYAWGVHYLLPAQRADGSWLGGGCGDSPVVGTCMALLFLKRADLLPGLRERLQRRVLLFDPVLGPTRGDPSPGPTNGSPKQSPGERPPDQPGKRG